ncbi:MULTISPECIES: GIY-YIG nuclease family protein [Bacillus]|uniref:GIY-YIG nuclease family protein n=1 Tax=Bacillus TaxID=1386 RepID=UPI0002DEB9EA|nr:MULTISPECIES: GIY-YIG nuclease family protein [Bacillus]
MISSQRELVKTKLNDIPDLPGIYKMLDSRRNIIYIGKSKCLKKRVKSYFVKSPKWEKVKKMVPFIYDIEYVTTDTHLEAMLLECELIKRVQPYFNVQMKNDSRYVYLHVGDEQISSPISIVHERGKDCYGPFRSKHVVENMLAELKNVYPITKNKSGYEFEYHVLPIQMTDIQIKENSEAIREMFKDIRKMDKFSLQLEKKMKQEAESFHFESAAKYRDIIRAIEYFKNGINRYKDLSMKHLLLKLKICKGYKLMYIVKGNVIYKQNYTSVTKKDQEKFMEQAKREYDNTKRIDHEKSNIDFLDILYSEILTLPKDAIYVIDHDS